MDSSQTLVSLTTSESVWTESSTTLERLPPNGQFLRRKIKQLESQVVEIEYIIRKREANIDVLNQTIQDLRSGIEDKKKRIENNASWHNALLKISERWLAVWESDFGKKLLNEKSAKTAENAIMISSLSRQVEYCKQWIEYFRRKKNYDELYSKNLSEFLEDESLVFENEIHELRKECLEWEKRAAFNRARTLEMISMRQSLLNQVDEKQMIVDEIKDDINEFERELLAVSYTLDQLSY